MRQDDDLDAVKLFREEACAHEILGIDEERALTHTIAEAWTVLAHVAEVSGDEVLRALVVGHHLAQSIKRALALLAADDSEGADEVAALLRRARAARESLILHNERLVLSIVRRYRGRGLDHADLIQEGNVGLMRAIDKFNPVSGYKFATYATWWIRQAVTRAVGDKGRNVRLPYNVAEKSISFAKERRRLTLELGREPTYAEIGARRGYSAELVEQVLAWADVTCATVSLDKPVTNRSGATGAYGGAPPDATTLGDFIAADAPGPDVAPERSEQAERVRAALATLPEREAAVLAMRYGIDRAECMFSEIGERFCVTRERARQIERAALFRLRHPTRARHLKGLAS
jgi:RNA polymerase sigma factor (sigma-70 family)